MPGQSCQFYLPFSSEPPWHWFSKARTNQEPRLKQLLWGTGRRRRGCPSSGVHFPANRRSRNRYLEGFLVYKVASLLVLLVLVVYTSLKWFNRNEVIDWLVETWTLARMIIPVLLIDFLCRALKALLPPKLILRFLGNNSLSSNLIASISGALMYFATLTEVPIIRALLDLGMNRGPALALLLSGPALSVPSMLVLGRILGVKKAALYIVLVVFFSTVSGLLFGRIIS